MVKQVLEIEVPDGKKALWKDGRVVFEDIGNMENIKNIDDFTIDDIKIVGYESYPKIYFPLSVG